MLSELVESIRQFLETEISPFAPDSFAIIYGSSVRTRSLQSDLDVAFVLSKAIPGIQERAEVFIRELHDKHSLIIDQEVPFANKLVYTPSQVRNALSLSYFIDPLSNRCVVSPVRKEKDFLASAEVNGRLLLNALTTPHIVVGETERVSRFQELAGRQICLLSITLLLQDNEKISPDNSFAVLETGRSGEKGEMYLGYKTEYEDTRKALKELLLESYNGLARDGTLLKQGDGWTMLDDPIMNIQKGASNAR